MKLLSLLFGCVCGLSVAQQDQPVVPPNYNISLPGHPFGIVTSQDDQWVFVALADDISGGSIAVLQCGGQGYGLVRVVPLRSAPTGIVMTHDGQLFVAPVLGSFSDGSNAGSVAVNVTGDDQWLYVCDENMSQITRHRSESSAIERIRRPINRRKDTDGNCSNCYLLLDGRPVAVFDQ